MDRKKALKIAKFTILGLIIALNVFLIYGIIGSFYVWTLQPTFYSVIDGASSRSFGFIVVGSFFIVFLFLALVGLALYVIFAFVRPIKKRKRAMLQEKEEGLN